MYLRLIQIDDAELSSHRYLSTHATTTLDGFVASPNNLLLTLLLTFCGLRPRNFKADVVSSLSTTVWTLGVSAKRKLRDLWVTELALLGQCL